MKPEKWVDAWRAGRVQHDWADLRLEADGLVGEFRVSAQPAKVDGVIRTGGAYAIQQFADMVGGVMLTPKMFVARHAQATVKVHPVVCDINHTTIEQADHLKYQALCHTEGTSGQWLVSGWDKTFCIDESCTPTTGVNEGFLVDVLDPLVRNGIGGHTYQGIGIYPTDVPGVLAIQERGARHGLNQGDWDDGDPIIPGVSGPDYSQDVYAAHGTCRINGVEVATDYTNPLVAKLTTHSGLPLPWSRHPGVPLLGDPTVAVPPVYAGKVRDNMLTRATLEQVGNALARVLPDVPAVGIKLLVAHGAFETAGFQSCHNWNFGNVKSRPDGSFGDYTFFTCGENLTLLQAQRMALDPRVTITKQYMQGDIACAEVRIVPDHPGSCFAAFDTIDAGAAFYATKLKRAFASTWPYVLTGDVAAFCHTLKLAHYYTADEALYTRGMMAWYNRV